MKKSILILAGGGPAPGINTVISTISKVFLRDGYRVIGLHEGYKNLFNGKAETIDIDFSYADRIINLGGSVLVMSRYKPSDIEFKTDFFVENNIKLLVTIGGDDTASTANRISKFLLKNDLNVLNIHVPKTIDNDLPLPEGQSTFGYASAKAEGVRIGTTVYEDARSSGNWFVVSAMGREAGHLAFGIGAACHYPLIIIPEMFNKTQLTLDKITDLIVSSIVKRKILNINYGVAIISEGIFNLLDESDLESSGIQFTYDEHGHPELGAVSKAHIYNILLQVKLKQLDLVVKSRPVEIGYEIRCASPTAADLLYCSLLGLGVKTLFDQGHNACIVTSNALGDIAPIFLKDLEDKNGKILPRSVNIESQRFQMVFKAQHYLEKKDLKKASKFLKNPEHYLISNILNW
ncbi:MAG: 6-phosphofructokinase [Lentimicrobiaceae bacterium]|jgi:6-phosphofructokinase|nr:6-phosphofructokinase [Lentimicrobiaceae bacterium]